MSKIRNYRGWSKELNRWVKGDLLTWGKDEKPTIKTCFNTQFEIEPESVGQSIGKNGHIETDDEQIITPLYEGDIAEYTYIIPGEKYLCNKITGVIVFNDSAYCVKTRDGKCYPLLNEDGDEYYIKILGNIIEDGKFL